MYRFVKYLLILGLSTSSFYLANAQIHPKEALGRKLFDSFRNQKFGDFYSRSIFSLEEKDFQEFLFDIENDELRKNLSQFYTLDYPANAQTAEARWRVAFAYTWRDQWRHITHHSPSMIQSGSFVPILREAKSFGIQWETTRLLAIEVLLPVHWEENKFIIKGDSMIEQNSTDPQTLFLDRRLTYRFQLDKSTHGNAFMIGYAPEDSDKIYKNNIVGNGSGQADILLRIDTPFPDRLFYFCPDVKNAGGPILIKNSDSVDKPNQRTDILLTFSYGQAEKAYQILIKEVLSTRNGEIFCEKPEWLGEVPLPRGLSFSH